MRELRRDLRRLRRHRYTRPALSPRIWKNGRLLVGRARAAKFSLRLQLFLASNFGAKGHFGQRAGGNYFAVKC